MNTATPIAMKPAISWPMGFSIGLLVILAALFHAPVVVPLVTEWYEHENFSYGFLIPLVFAYLVYQRWPLVRQERPAPEAWGAGFLAGSITLGLIGDLLGEPFISRVSLVATVASAVLLIAGWRVWRLLAFPLAYLLLMVPPPYIIVKQVSYYLKVFDAIVATPIVQLMGVPVHRDSFFLNLPNITLEVADVCSGIASLFAMIALGTVYIYFLPARPGAKLLALAGALVFPVIANLIRIVLIAVSVYYYGPIMLQAFFHAFTGTFTFLLSLALFLIFGEWLRRKYPAAERGNRSGAALTESSAARPRNGAIPVLLGAVVLAGGLYVSHAIAVPESRRLQGNLQALPQELGIFRSSADMWPDAYSDAAADETLSRLYQDPQGAPVELFVGYRGAQHGAERLKSPKLIFPEGWEYAAMDGVEIPGQAGRNIDATWLLTKKGRSRRLVLFWYQLPEGTFSSDVRYRWALARRSIAEGRSDGAVVRLATGLSDSETVKEGLQRLVDFSQQLSPHVRLLMLDP